MVKRSILALCSVICTLLVEKGVLADIYMHSPRGSNNRNARSDNNENTRNQNRLFDSQNNAKGGYSAPRAWPFACYKVVDDDAAFAQCTAQNEGAGKEALDANGELLNPDGINTPSMYYFSGSELYLEWTVQHGMGTNEEVLSDVIVQYACEDTLQDNCDVDPSSAANAPTCLSPFKPNPRASNSVCSLRDGTPIRVVDGNTQLNVEATETIPENGDDQDDMRYGRHETLAYYNQCKNRERNKGLWTADQQLQTNDARSTRQNPDATRYGLECPEEAAYYPYWHHSPWKDIAVITSNLSKCEFYRNESQNVRPRGRCDCGDGCPGDGEQPNTKEACEAAGFSWCQDAAHGIPPPDCVLGAYSRANHLGNVASTQAGTQAQTYSYVWTIPEVSTTGNPMRCVLRMRYNMSSSDFGAVSVNGDATLNGDNSPLKDNDENEEASYLSLAGSTFPASKAKLGFAVNTDQFSRTFQDRSYTFEIFPAKEALLMTSNINNEDNQDNGEDGKQRRRRRNLRRQTQSQQDGNGNGENPRSIDNCKRIHNVGVKGKRGNIVQTFPSVEYDFAPSLLEVYPGECVHLQWTGSDYNPNRNGNNGEGGPYASNNQKKETKSDRSNFVQIADPAANFPITDLSQFSMFPSARSASLSRLVFLDQAIGDDQTCWTFDKLQETFNTRAEREETHHNCMKLSGASTPYFDGGVFRVPDVPGVYRAMSTRNENFSNRQQKFTLVVLNATVSSNTTGGETVPNTGNDGDASNTTQDPPPTAKASPLMSPTAKAVLAIGLIFFALLALVLYRKYQANRLRARSRPRAEEQRDVSNGGSQSDWNASNIKVPVNSQEDFLTAKWDFTATQENEIDLTRGDRIMILHRDKSGWWYGRNLRTNRQGYFPANQLAA